MRRQKPGLDELMIVNPGPGENHAVLLGDDGVLYRLRLVGRMVGTGCPCRCRQRRDGPRRRLLRALNGRLYEVLE
ncbi:MAG TPA: hypothetical protein VGJ44_23155 [Kribbellaceae bacterium]|jgi:hypothetical protein